MQQPPHDAGVRRTSTARRSRAGRVGAALLSLGLLASCADPTLTPLPPQTESETATPTPTATSGAYFSEPPASADEAIDHALVAYDHLLATTAEVYANPTDTSSVASIAVGPPADEILESAATLIERGAVGDYSGTTYVVDRSATTTAPATQPDGSITEHGTVNLAGCLDTTARSLTNADGTDAPIDGPRVLLVDVTVSFDAPSSQWFVTLEGPHRDDAGHPIPC